MSAIFLNSSMGRILFSCLFAVISISASSLNISVRIYNAQSIESAIVAPYKGVYTVSGDGKTIDSCCSTRVYEIRVSGDSVKLKMLGKLIGTFGSIRLRGISAVNQFNIRPVSANVTRLYDDDFTASAKDGELTLVNLVQIEHYVAGVVECESGKHKSPEYFKVQAVICRTYALSNTARHISDGFELCDGVHCQVYRGVATAPAVIQAVQDTKGLVLVDQNNALIDAAFHSNCGGYTLNSEDVWSAPLSYLRAIRDTFCLNMPDARWEKHFTRLEWENYLKKKEKSLQPDTLRREAYWDSIPPFSRVYLYDRGYAIPLKDIRADLSLNSTYFTVDKDSAGVTLHGRGFGHRVGLCQEGAMHMAQLSFNFRQILNFYYTNVQMIDYNILPSSGLN